MSSEDNFRITNDNEEVIQHIDDVYEANYVENFAPKAQEEILSEFQDNQICDSEQISINNESNIATENDSSKNLVDEEESEKSESVEISNEDINEVSNQLIDKVVIEAESNLINEDEQNNSVEENRYVEVEEENFEQSKVQIQTVDSEKEIIEGDVDMAESIPSGDFNEETKDHQLYTDNSYDEPIKEINEEINLPEEINEIDLTSNVSGANVESCEQALEVTEVNESSAINDDEVTSDFIINNEVAASDKKEPEQRKEDEVKEIPLATKGKDVKSLLSTYGQEDKMENGNCCVCNKIVYPLEKLSANGRLFHKICFRCAKCNSALSAGNFTFNLGRPYCTPHYLEYFKKRGRYDEVDANIEIEISTTTNANKDELPEKDTTKNMRAKFQDLQSSSCSNNVNQTITAESLNEMPAPNTTKNLKERFQSIGQDKPELKCKPKIDIPRHTNGHQNGSSENEPQVLPSDVVRASEPSQDDRPVEGITKNRVKQFGGMGGEANN